MTDMQRRADELGPPEERTLRLGDLSWRRDMQIRALPALDGPLAVDRATVDKYKVLYQEGVDLGLLVVVETADGDDLGADGFHRSVALRELYGADYQADVLIYSGTEDDARLLGCELNSGRGLSFTSADTLKAAGIYLAARARQGVNPTDTAVGRILGCSRFVVASARAKLTAELPSLAGPRQTTRGGQALTLVPANQHTVPALVEEEEEDGVDAFRALPNPQQQSRMAPRGNSSTNGNGTHQRSASGPAWRETSVGQQVLARDGMAYVPPVTDPEEPAVTPGDPVALALRWVWVDADGMPHEGDARHKRDFERLPDAVRDRLLGWLGVSYEQLAEVLRET